MDYKIFIVIGVACLCVVIVYFYYEISSLKQMINPLHMALHKLSQPVITVENKKDEQKKFDNESYLYTMTEKCPITDVAEITNAPSEKKKEIIVPEKEDIESVTEYNNKEFEDENSAVSLNKLCMKDLKKKAKEANINVLPTLRKHDLIKKIIDNKNKI